MGTTLVIVAITLLAAVLAFAASRPKRLRVQRSERIEAPPERIFEHIEDLHRWEGWSPWERLDPTMKKTYSGAARGKGAVYAWEGNSKVGQGRMEILATTPPTRALIQLDFLKPWKSSNTTEFTLDPQGDSTRVTWSMEGPSPFVARLMGLFMNMDRMIGKDFEAGLRNLKGLSETA